MGRTALLIEKRRHLGRLKKHMEGLESRLEGLRATLSSQTAAFVTQQGQQVSWRLALWLFMTLSTCIVLVEVPGGSRAFVCIVGRCAGERGLPTLRGNHGGAGQRGKQIHHLPSTETLAISSFLHCPHLEVRGHNLGPLSPTHLPPVRRSPPTGGDDQRRAGLGRGALQPPQVRGGDPLLTAGRQPARLLPGLHPPGRPLGSHSPREPLTARPPRLLGKPHSVQRYPLS
jgi:hypothetical protein